MPVQILFSLLVLALPISSEASGNFFVNPSDETLQSEGYILEQEESSLQEQFLKKLLETLSEEKQVDKQEIQSQNTLVEAEQKREDNRDKNLQEDTNEQEQITTVQPVKIDENKVEDEKDDQIEEKTQAEIAEVIEEAEEAKVVEKAEEVKLVEEVFTLPQYYPLYPANIERPVGNIDFSVIKHGSDTGVKVLIAGGIQGDEPGGFSAASLLASHYSFSDAQVHIIPNLNFDSIVKKSRGTSGDMNRKFAHIDKNDPQYDEVQRLKDYIADFQPDILINLHDGSGFYSPEYISSLRNKNRWGQSLIIDKEKTDAPYGHLKELASKIVARTNKKVTNKEYIFHVHNTRTDEGNVEMEKSLSWYGIRQGIASFGFEVSKEFNKPTRVYYHLLQLESFFEELDIAYARNFLLSVDGVDRALETNAYVSFADGRVTFPLNDLKQTQAGYLPLPKNVTFTSPIPIVATVQKSQKIVVHNGNNTLTSIPTEEYTLSKLRPVFNVNIDGQEQQVHLGDIIHVQDSFTLEHQQGFRVNAIGARREKPIDGVKTEANVMLARKDFNAVYSLDKAENMYRIEIYHGKDFVGMFVVDFASEPFEYIIFPYDENREEN